MNRPTPAKARSTIASSQAPPKLLAQQADLDLGIGHTAATATRLVSWEPDSWPVAADWQPALRDFLASQSGRQLGAFLSERLSSGATIYPAQPLRALALTALRDVKVLILGQDPYHGPGQAQGLAFSVAPSMRPPPSLRNILKEVARDPALAGRPALARPTEIVSLQRWASQGVLLLNTCLSVEAGAPGSHAKQGWEQLTDQIVHLLAVRPQPVVFMLWGAQAQAKKSLIDLSPTAANHLLLMANHPSPLSALRGPLPFIGCGHFGKANHFLQQNRQATIDWQ